MKTKKNTYEQNNISSLAEEPMTLYLSSTNNKNLVLNIIDREIGSKDLLARLIHLSGLTIQFLAQSIFEMTPKTFIKYKNNDVKLPSRIAELAIELGALYELGNELFGSNDAFNDWLNTPNPFVGDRLPSSYLNTSSGINLIYEELKSIEFGTTA